MIISRTLEEIRNKQWSEEELESLRRIAERQAAGDDSQINYEDIPPVTDEQWARMVPFRDRKKLNPPGR